MIDLHCHMLPGIDDGAADIDTALAMARLASDDNIQTVACTPHIYPGLYHNTGPGIRSAADKFSVHLAEAGINLSITYGADTHLAPNLIAGLRNQEIPTLHGSRYFLLEPPHHVAPPNLQTSVFSLIAAGYVPIITHPERLTWIKDHYELFRQLVHSGAWLQVTAGSLTGRFGSAARYWGERLLDEGLTHILATDAHGVSNRPPILSEGAQAAERWVGSEEARHLVWTRPQAILDNLSPAQAPALPVMSQERHMKPFPRTRLSGPATWFRRLFGRR